MKLNPNLIERLENITSTDYSFTPNGETENWDSIVEDLIMYYEDLLEEYNDYKSKGEDEISWEDYYDV